jgi:hypothetical protein
VCSSSGSKSRGGPYTPAAGGGASGYTSKAGSPPAGFPSTSGNYQVSQHVAVSTMWHRDCSLDQSATASRTYQVT